MSKKVWYCLQDVEDRLSWGGESEADRISSAKAELSNVKEGKVTIYEMLPVREVVKENGEIKIVDL